MGKGSYWIEVNPKEESMIMYGNSDTGDYFEFKYKKPNGSVAEPF